MRDVRVWNTERSVIENQWWDSKMEVGECWKAVREAAARGRKDKEVEDGAELKAEKSNKSNGATSYAESLPQSSEARDVGSQTEATGIEVEQGMVSFGSATEWLDLVGLDVVQQHFSEESKYWTQIIA